MAKKAAPQRPGLLAAAQPQPQGAQMTQAERLAEIQQKVAADIAAARAKQAAPAPTTTGDTWTGEPGAPTQGKTNTAIGQGNKPLPAPGPFTPGPNLYNLKQVEAEAKITVSGFGLGGAEIPGVSGVATRVVTGQELESEFWALPLYQQVIIEKQMFYAGFFSSSVKITDLDKMGTPGMQGEVTTAFGNAIDAAAQTGQEFTSMLSTAAATGQATKQPLQRPAIIGHGPNNMIDLTNPDDVRAMAQSVFQGALGRAPTEQELADVATSIHGQEESAGKQKFTVEEGSAEQDFAARQAERDANFALATGQNVPGNVAATPVAGSTGNPLDAGLAGLGTGAGSTPPSQGGATTVGPVTLASSPKGAPGVLAFLAATIAHESLGSGQYTAQNPGGASGAYQFLPGTWAQEAKAAGYGQYANTRTAQVPPAIQDAVAAFYATNLYAKAGGDWAKVAKAWYAGDSNMNRPDSYYPGGNNAGLTVGAYASFVTNYMTQHGTPGDPSSAGLAGLGTGAGTVAGSQPIGGGGYVNPLSQGSWGLARTDMGVDYIPKTPSPILALGNGVVIRSTMASGWPGGAFIAYKLTDGPAAGQVVYVAEHLTGLIPVGTQVKAGQQIAVGQPGYPYIETGWANSTGTAPIVQYGTAPDGTPMEGGKDFARLMIKLGAGAMQDPGSGPIYPGGPDVSTISPGVSSGVSNQVGGVNTTVGNPNDQFTPGSTTDILSPAAASSVAFTAASTGANLLPYGAHNAIGAVATINQMIRQNRGVQGTGG